MEARRRVAEGGGGGGWACRWEWQWRDPQRWARMPHTHTHTHTKARTTHELADLKHATLPSSLRLLLQFGPERGHDADGQTLTPDPADDDVADEAREDPQHHLLVPHVRLAVRQVEALSQLEGSFGRDASSLAGRGGGAYHQGADVVVGGVHAEVVEPVRVEGSSSSSSNRILMSCQPHRVTSGQSNSGHKQIHISKLFSHMYQPSVNVKSVYKTNHFVNIKHIYTNIRHKFSKG